MHPQLYPQSCAWLPSTPSAETSYCSAAKPLVHQEPSSLAHCPVIAQYFSCVQDRPAHWDECRSLTKSCSRTTAAEVPFWAHLSHKADCTRLVLLSWSSGLHVFAPFETVSFSSTQRTGQKKTAEINTLLRTLRHRRNTHDRPQQETYTH